MDVKNTKTYLVTGGAGFIGSHLCDRLTREGHRVISLDNYSTGSEKNHVDGVQYLKGDTKDVEALLQEIPDCIFHLGEYSRVEQSFADVAQVLRSNVVGTQAILEYVRNHKTKLVYAGSSTKFADGGMGRHQSPYAWTKATNTELVMNYAKWFDFPYAITYFYNVYGPRERGDTASGTVVGIFKEKYLQGEPLTVRAPGTQRRNFTHVRDIIDGLVRVGEKGCGDEYGLGHKDTYSILELAELFGGETEMLPERPGNRADSHIDCTRAILELGWSPKHSLPEYINEIKSKK